MTTLKLDIEALAVESFEAASETAWIAPAAAAPTNPFCSAIDACPTRLCNSRIC